MKRILYIMAALAVLVTVACQKEESSPPLTPSNALPSGGQITFGDEIRTLESVLEKNPKQLSALIELGNLYMDSKRFDDAIGMYQRALEIDPNNQNVRVDMGSCYRYSGRSDLAIEVYKKAIEMDPNHANAHLNLGVVYYDDLRAYDKAIPEFEKFIELEPNSERADEIRGLVKQLKSNFR